MRWGIVVAAAVGWIGNAYAWDSLTIAAVQSPPTTLNQAVPEEALSARYLKACSVELKNRNLPDSVGDCEKLLERSHLIQSEAIRYLAQANDKEREAFGGAPTLVRYEIVGLDVDPVVLMPILLDEKETATSGMVVQLARDVMKSSCGYYQIDIIIKALGDADSLPQQPKKAPSKSVKLEYKSCISGTLQDGKVADCLNPIFQAKQN